MKIELNPQLASEFQYIFDLLQLSGDDAFASPEHLINYVLRAIADGSRRPGSWERSVIYQLGIVADHPLHHVYRATYGEPK